MYSYRLVSFIVAAANGVKLQSALLSRILSRNNVPARAESKRRKSITVMPQPTVANAIETRGGNDADDIDNDNVCVICQGSLSREPVQFVQNDTDVSEGEVDCYCCCDLVEVRAVRPLPESTDVDEWNVKLKL